jgi:hypothetical protein
MKTIKLIAVIVLFVGTNLFSQNLWQNQVDLNFTIQSNTKVSSFADASGIHIVYYRNGGIRYALVNSQGGVIKYDKVIEAEGSGTDFANVAAIGNNVYAIYYKNNDIKVARSTNLGNSWSTSFSSRPLINTACNKIIAYRDGSNIQITWSERRSGSSYINDVHYIKFSPSPNPTWDEYKRVSENDYDGGENPDLAFTSEKVEVDYTSFNQPKNRERLSSNNWNNSEDVPYYQFPLTNQVKGIKPLITGSNLNVIYLDNWNGWPGSGVYIGHSYRSLSSTTWYQNQSILTTDMIDMNTPYPYVTNNTADGKIHLIYWDKNLSYFAHRYITGTTISSVVAEIIISTVSNNLTPNSNDLYLIQTNNDNTPGKIKFRHYDAAPSAPTNLTSFLDPDPSCNNCHGSGPGIRLDWNKNNEPDLSYYTIFRAEQSGNCYSCHGSGAGTSQDSTSTVTETITVQQECPALSGEQTDFSSSTIEVETGCLSGLQENEILIFEPI